MLLYISHYCMNLFIFLYNLWCRRGVSTSSLSCSTLCPWHSWGSRRSRLSYIIFGAGLGYLLLLWAALRSVLGTAEGQEGADYPILSLVQAWGIYFFFELLYALSLAQLRVKKEPIILYSLWCRPGVSTFFFYWSTAAINICTAALLQKKHYADY
jgi:hypothetical protein